MTELAPHRPGDAIARLERRAERERKARLAAETLLEAKSRELYSVNQELHKLAAELEVRVEDRTRELVEARERAIELAERDSLTQLPNRACFARVLEDLLTKADAEQRSLALFLIDLDRFKSINDTLGHDCGDALLRHAANQLKRSLGPNDVVARLGGDEFAAICDVTGRLEHIEIVASRMAAYLREPCIHRERNVTSTCSAGVAVYPRDALTLVDLQRYADIALYRSKAAGRALCTEFTPEMGRQAHERQVLEGDLKRANLAGEIKPWFQPVVPTSIGETCSAEILARWHHPTRGLIYPGSFISIVEECGLIGEMFCSLLSEACTLARPWIANGGLKSIAINVAPSQFRSRTLVNDVLRILSETSMPAQHVTIEITEDALIDDLESVSAQLEVLTKWGVRASLDDFGSGYSNIGYLRRLPINAIKLDRSLTGDVVNDDKARSIVRSVCDIATCLGLDLVAEGIETEAQALWLGRSGCRYLQGYLFGKPMPAEAFDKWQTSVMSVCRLADAPAAAVIRGAVSA